MNDIDRKISAALQRDTADDYLAAEPNLAEEVINVFRGRRRWMHGVVVAVCLAFLALTVWASFRFYGAEIVRDQLRFGAIAFAALLVISLLKVWFWLEMHTNRTLRELKRMELLLISRVPEADQKVDAA